MHSNASSIYKKYKIIRGDETIEVENIQILISCVEEGDFIEGVGINDLDTVVLNFEIVFSFKGLVYVLKKL
jgi:hypothetical protein